MRCIKSSVGIRFGRRPGVRTQSLYKWLKLFAAPSPRPGMDHGTENQRLKRVRAPMAEERDSLEKALLFSASITSRSTSQAIAPKLECSRRRARRRSDCTAERAGAVQRRPRGTHSQQVGSRRWRCRRGGTGSVGATPGPCAESVFCARDCETRATVGMVVTVPLRIYMKFRQPMRTT